MENKKTILIVEDERPIAKALSLKLSGVGFNVSIAKNGEDALKIIEGTQFDLILLDLIMPKIDGFGVLKALKNKGLNIPVIVLTNLGQEEDVKRVKDLGAYDCFVKSDISLISIIERIQKLLEIK